MRNLATRVASVLLLVSVVACVEQDENKPTADDLATAKQNLLSAPPTPKYPVNADLDGKVVFVGTDVRALPDEGVKGLKRPLCWRVVAPPGDGWKTLTHVEGPGRQAYLNADHTPVEGKYAVDVWKAGDIIRDAHTIHLP